ncbi:hypothetical protein ABU162_28150 [Paenibacillus thiaminolyticus]|uniref:hypothetical protein n=1 Tax=Paenibacillus thiaminolyticus TaxID=49283 RepID=UPI0035A6E43E
MGKMNSVKSFYVRYLRWISTSNLGKTMEIDPAAKDVVDTDVYDHYQKGVDNINGALRDGSLIIREEICLKKWLIASLVSLSIAFAAFTPMAFAAPEPELTIILFC